MYSQQVWLHSYSWTINSKQLLSTQPRRSTKSSQGDQRRCLAPLCRVLTQLIGLSATRFSDLCLSFIIYYCSHAPRLSPPPSLYGMWFSVSPAVCVCGGSGGFALLECIRIGIVMNSVDGSWWWNICRPRCWAAIMNPRHMALDASASGHRDYGGRISAIAPRAA